MKAKDVTGTLDLAIAASDCIGNNILRLLSNNGVSSMVGELAGVW